MMFDVAIVGGGPAASVTAWMLARGGASCVILERGDDSGDKPGESLPPSARPLLEQLGLWDALAADGHLPCHGNRSSWGSHAIDEHPFVFSPYGHGWHIDRRRFEALLVARAVAGGVQRRTQTRVVGIEGRILRCDDGTSVRARFLVDATGRAAWLARRLGARHVVDDRLVAYVTFACDDAERDSFTFVEALETGWRYTAPIPDGRVVTMFVTDPATMGEGRRVDASSIRLDRVAGRGWLAVGDAAAALDPLSSHGLGSAIAGALEAARAILEGSFDRYERMVDAMWNSYVRVRHATYALEQRWPGSPFWRYRINTTSTASTEWAATAREPFSLQA